MAKPLIVHEFECGCQWDTPIPYCFNHGHHDKKLVREFQPLRNTEQHKLIRLRAWLNDRNSAFHHLPKAGQLATFMVERLMKVAQAGDVDYTARILRSHGINVDYPADLPCPLNAVEFTDREGTRYVWSNEKAMYEKSPSLGATSMTSTVTSAGGLHLTAPALSSEPGSTSE